MFLRRVSPHMFPAVCCPPVPPWLQGSPGARGRAGRPWSCAPSWPAWKTSGSGTQVGPCTGGGLELMPNKLLKSQAQLLPLIRSAPQPAGGSLDRLGAGFLTSFSHSDSAPFNRRCPLPCPPTTCPLTTCPRQSEIPPAWCPPCPVTLLYHKNSQKKRFSVPLEFSPSRAKPFHCSHTYSPAYVYPALYHSLFIYITFIQRHRCRFSPRGPGGGDMAWQEIEGSFVLLPPAVPWGVAEGPAAPGGLHDVP